MRCDIRGSRQTDWILDVGLGVFCVVLLMLTTGFILVVRFIISGRYRCWAAVIILLTYCMAWFPLQCLLPVNEARCISGQCNTCLFLINPVNGLAFVCLSFHFMMLGSSYELSNYQFAES